MTNPTQVKDNALATLMNDVKTQVKDMRHVSTHDGQPHSLEVTLLAWFTMRDMDNDEIHLQLVDGRMLSVECTGNEPCVVSISANS